MCDFAHHDGETQLRGAEGFGHDHTASGHPLQTSVRFRETTPFVPNPIIRATAAWWNINHFIVLGTTFIWAFQYLSASLRKRLPQDSMPTVKSFLYTRGTLIGCNILCGSWNDLFLFDDSPGSPKHTQSSVPVLDPHLVWWESGASDMQLHRPDEQVQITRIQKHNSVATLSEQDCK